MYRRSKQLYFYVDHVFDRECRLFLFFFLEEQVKNQYFCRYNVKVFHLTPRHLFISPNCFQILNSTVFAVATEKWYWLDFLKYYIKRQACKSSTEIPKLYILFLYLISYYLYLNFILLYPSLCFSLFPGKNKFFSSKRDFFFTKIESMQLQMKWRVIWM